MGWGVISLTSKKDCSYGFWAGSPNCADERLLLEKLEDEVKIYLVFD